MGYGNPPPEIFNLVVEVDLRATVEDNFYFQSNPDEQYVGLYHRHQDGTLMIGAGVINMPHAINPDEIIFRKISYEDIQDTREKVSDLFYKIWFQSNTLSDDELLSLQTTIRDGKKQSGRTEEEPLVFYKKDRNTLENRKDIEGDVFEQMCQYIFTQQIIDLENYFQIILQELPSENNQEVVQYVMRLNHDGVVFDINVARKVGNEFSDILNLSQLTKPKFGSRIDAEKAREVLDTNIFELLPNQTTRQDEINDFFTQFDDLIGPTPVFQDPDDDGAGEDIQNYEQDEQSRISFENQPNAFITRLDEQAEGSSINQGKTLESMRNRLNTYLGDVDNVIETLEDDRPEYQNISDGFLKIRKPNQAIIVRAPGGDLLEFQKGNSYLTDGFTITMWVRFVSKTSEGTLFNFGNPLEDNGEGFRLETRTNIDSAGNYKRWIRLAVREGDGTLRDNHWGGPNHQRRLATEGSPIGFYSDTVIHQLYPNISTEDLNEWYFICATYNPEIREVLDTNNLFVKGGESQYAEDSKRYWLNHQIRFNTADGSFDGHPEAIGNFTNVGNAGDIVANSLEGARCKVEIISRSDLLRARGFKVDDLTIDAPTVDGLEEDEDSLIGENGDGNGVGGGDGNNGIEPSVGGVDDIINPSSEPPSEQSSEEETEEEIERPLEEREEEETSSPTITIRSSGGGY